MKELFKHPLNLQLFAGDEPQTIEPTLDPGPTVTEPQVTAQTFTPEQLDQINQLMTGAFTAWQTQTEDAQTEAQKLANMTEAQKRAYEADKRQKELDDREAKLVAQELKTQAVTQLQEQGLPVTLADLLDQTGAYTSAESCDQSITTLTKAFNDAVAKEVENRIKGGLPPKSASSNTTTSLFTMEDIKNMTTAEINANWDAIQEVIKRNK